MIFSRVVKIPSNKSACYKKIQKCAESCVGLRLNQLKVTVKLKKIYNMHGIPDNLKSDRGKEIYGAVKRFCEKKR